MGINWPAWDDENLFKCEKEHVLSEMSKINLRWVSFNLEEWTLFKRVSKICTGLKRHQSDR